MSPINWLPERKKSPLGYFTRQQGSYKRAWSIVYHGKNRNVPDSCLLASLIERTRNPVRERQMQAEREFNIYGIKGDRREWTVRGRQKKR